MFDWIQELTNGIGQSVGSAISGAWESIADSVWGKYMSWLYSLVYGALADFFTLMTDIGAELFDLAWVKAALKFFSLFGWGLFLAGLVVAIFDIAIEYQSMGRINVTSSVSAH